MTCRTTLAARYSTLAREGALAFCVLLACAACVPSVFQRTAPVPGASGQDGLTVATAAMPETARGAAVRALQANGFAIDGGASSRSTVRTRARTVAADTSLIVSALVTPVDLASTRALITLSATVSVPSAGVRHAQLVWRAGDARGAWRVLEAVRDSLRQMVASGP